MDQYPDVYGKLALALTSSQVAKQDVVATLGIGEDLPFCFWGWRDGTLMAMMGLSPETMALPVVQRLPIVGACAQVMRQIFHCDSITLGAEGFIAKKGLKGRDAKAAFVDPENDVEECVTACHLHINRHGKPDATIVSIPYQYLVGRHLVWGDSSVYEHGVGKVLKDSPVIAMMALELIAEIPHFDEETSEAALDALCAQGVGIQPFALPPWLE